jgi:cobalamin synthase
MSGWELASFVLLALLTLLGPMTAMVNLVGILLIPLVMWIFGLYWLKERLASDGQNDVIPGIFSTAVFITSTLVWVLVLYLWHVVFGRNLDLIYLGVLAVLQFICSNRMSKRFDAAGDGAAQRMAIGTFFGLVAAGIVSYSWR